MKRLRVVKLNKIGGEEDKKLKNEKEIMKKLWRE